MSAHEEEVTGGVEIGANEAKEEKSVRLSPVMIDEGIKVSFEPLQAQISALTEMIDRLFHSNSGKEFTTASTCELRHQFESLFNGAPGNSTFLTAAPLTGPGYSPDNGKL